MNEGNVLAYPSRMSSTLAPSTRYQGSKRKLLPWLRAIFEGIEFSSVVDLMAGTSSVAYTLKRMDKSVLANDYLCFNYMTAIAFVENDGIKLSEDDIRSVSSISLGRRTGFITETFRGMYFTDHENQWLDAACRRIDDLWPDLDHPTWRYKRALAHHALAQACISKRPFNLFHRKNLYLRQATVSRKFGNKTTWETPFPVLFARFANEANSFVTANGQSNFATNVDVSDVTTGEADLVYLDPPYFGSKRERVRSNYRTQYHFIEGMARYEQWPQLVDLGHTLRTLALPPSSLDAIYSCTSERVEDIFIDWLNGIMRQWPSSKIVLSYKHPGLPPVRRLREAIIDTGRSVRVHGLRYKYALNRRNGRPGENIELVLVGQ